MKIQTLLGKVRYQQDFIYFFNKVIADIKFKTVKMTAMAVLVVNELAKANDRDAKPIVVVVSPLVALMEDQVKEAEKLFPYRAVAW